MGVQRHNHHAASYEQISKFTMDLLPLTPFKTVDPSLRKVGRADAFGNHERWMVKCFTHTTALSREQFV